MTMYKLALLFLLQLPSSFSHNDVCGNFAAHAGTAVTFDGVQTTIDHGNVGVSPGTSITGAYLLDDGEVVAESTDFAAAKLAAHAAAIKVPGESMAIEMGGKTFTPGTYRSGSAINIAYGTVVTLDGDGDFLFQAGTTLITAAGTSFILKNGAKAENVVWALGTAATLGASSKLPGSILAGTAITFGTKSVLNGCALAQSAVTFESKGSVVLPNYAEVTSTTVEPTATMSPDSLEPLSYNSVCDNFIAKAGTVLTFGAAATANGGNLGYGTAIVGASDGAVLITSGGVSALADKHAAAMADRGNWEPLPATFGGAHFTAGNYRSAGAVGAAAGTVVTLTGDADSIFLFQAYTLTIAAGSSIVLEGGVKAENVFWALDTAATLGANALLEGSIIAGTAITLGAEATLHGCTMAGTAITFGAGASIDSPPSAEEAEATLAEAARLQELSFDRVCGVDDDMDIVHAGTVLTFGAAATANGGNVSYGTAIVGASDGATLIRSVDASNFSTKHAALMAKRADSKVLPAVFGGRTFTEGNYHSAGAVGTAAGTVVTLEGNANSIFLFQASALTIAAGSSIVLDGVDADNVFWALDTTATLGANAILEGSIIAGTAITLGANAALHGCTLAGTAITLGAASSIDSPENAAAAALSATSAPTPGPLTFPDVCGDYAVQAGTVLTVGASTSAQGGHVGYGSAMAGDSGFQYESNLDSTVDSSVLAAKHADAMAKRAVSAVLPGAIGGRTFTPGTYRSIAAVTAAAATVVTLDGGDDATAKFLFQAGTLGMGADSSILLTNGAQAKNVFWAVNTVAVLGANALMEGSIIAGTTITLGAEATLHGCTLAGTAITFGAGASTNGNAVGQLSSANGETSSDQLSFAKVCGVDSEGEGVAIVQAATVLTFGAAATAHGGNVAYGSAIAGSPALETEKRLFSTVDSSDLARKHAWAMAKRDDSTPFAGAIGGQIFTPGIYRSTAAVTTAAATVVTLDGLNAADPVFLFQASALGMGAGSSIVLTNGAKAENVFWALDTAAALGANTILEGSIIAGTAITLGAEAVLHGCTLARTAITLGASASIDSPENAIAAATALSEQAGNPVTLSFDNVCGVDYAVQAGTALTFGASTSVQGGNVGYGTAIVGTSDLDAGKRSKSGIDSSVLSTDHTALMAERVDSIDLPAAIGDLTFYPGTHRSTTPVAAAAGTVVTLDAKDTPGAIFLFQAGTLGMGAGSSISLKGGAKAENVFWVVNTVAALGANVFLQGSIIAGTTIALGAEAVSNGCIIAGTTVAFGAAASVNAASLNTETSDGSSTSFGGDVCGAYAVRAGTAVTFGATTMIQGGKVGYGSVIAGSSTLKDGATIESPIAIDSGASVTTHAEAMAVQDVSDVLPGTIGTQTFGPGTYRSIAAVTTAAGTVVTLNGGNNPDAKFLFQASTLNIGANTRIHLINAKAENVFWAVDTTAVLGADTVFVGSIIAGTAITLGAGAMLQGCALAGTAVTLGAGASIDVSGPTLAARRNLRGEKK